MTKCSYLLCKTGLPGIIVPIIEFRAIRSAASIGLTPGRAIVGGVTLCESCALTAKVHEIVDDRRWSDICRQIASAGGPLPDRDSLELHLGSPKGNPLPQAFQHALMAARKN